MLMYARENVGKSAYVLYRLARLAAAQRHVVYVCGEGLPGILDRLDGIISAHGLNAGLIEQYLHVVADVPQLSVASQIEELLEQIQALDEPISVVVLDTLSTATIGLNENAPEVMSAAFGGMRRIMRALECAGILVHHAGKDLTRGARGHSNLGGAVDISVEVTREDESNVITLRCKKMRDDAPFAPFAYELRSIALDEYADRTTIVAFPGAEVPMVEDKPVKLNKDALIVLDVLQRNNGHLRSGQWQKLTEIQSISKSAHYRHVSALREAGRVSFDETLREYVVVPENSRDSGDDY